MPALHHIGGAAHQFLFGQMLLAVTMLFFVRSTA
jgi:hypothetical protein